MWIYRRYHVSKAIMNHPQIFHKWVVKNHWHIDYGLVYHCLTNMGWSTWFPLRGKHSGWWLVSGLYWGLYDRLWEFLATSNYSFTAQVALEILGLLSGFCWVGWRFEASWGRTRNEIPSKSFVFFAIWGVEFLHFWIFSQHFWRVHAANFCEDGKMVIGPSMWSEDDRNADI